jgi:hypothetical protein
MAVWTPGSYLVREYSRNVEGVAAAGRGRHLAAGDEVGQEPLADRDRRGDSRSSALSRLRARDERPDELHRPGVRADQRRRDILTLAGDTGRAP